MESVIFPAARFRMMRSHYYSSSLLHRKHIISHIDRLVPAAICVEMGLALFSRNRSHVSPAVASPINMPNRHTRTLPNPGCNAAERCGVDVAVADPGDDTEFDDDRQNSGNQGRL
jgi:hypothetical protein